jgi:predicted tellurium resistance membrane protein TerC
VAAIERFQTPFLTVHSKAVDMSVNVHSLIVLAGGMFVIYTAVKEIYHMMSLDVSNDHQDKQRSLVSAMFWIVTMNLVFSFDSILSAIALAGNMEHGMVIMALAIVASGVLMIVLADQVSEFLRKNRLYEVLGLFILFIVGIMLTSEGGHLAHLQLFGHAVEPMAKSTFYFVIFILVVVDIVQGRYQKQLMARSKRQQPAPEPPG